MSGEGALTFAVDHDLGSISDAVRRRQPEHHRSLDRATTNGRSGRSCDSGSARANVAYPRSTGRSSLIQRTSVRTVVAGARRSGTRGMYPALKTGFAMRPQTDVNRLLRRFARHRSQPLTGSSRDVRFEIFGPRQHRAITERTSSQDSMVLGPRAGSAHRGRRLRKLPVPNLGGMCAVQEALLWW